MSTSQTKSERVRDVAVIGGGMAGAPLAAALAERGLDVSVVDGRPWPVQGAGGAPGPERVSALNAGTRTLLERVGIWQHIPEAHPIRDIEVTTGDRPGRATLDPRSPEANPFGHVVENAALVDAAWQRLGDQDRVQCLRPAAVESVGPAEGGVRRLGYRDADGTPAELRARLVVGADGEHSRVRQAAGIGVRGWHHNRYAVVATVTLARHHGGRAYERFRDPGPLAVLPFGERRATLVWTLGPEEAEARVRESEARFLARLQGEVGPGVGRVTAAGPRAAYPLELRLAKRLIGDRVALVGNAGHLLHPVAGQGFNLGMRDVGVLAEVLGEARERGWDVGHPSILDRYAARRRTDMARSVALTEGLNRLFSQPGPLLARARETGLRLFDRLPGAKEALVRQAAGLEALELWQEEGRS